MLRSARTPHRLGAAAVAMLLLSTGVDARLVPCRHPTDTSRIADAVDRIWHSIDPCGESAEVVGLLERLDRCPTARYEICTDVTATRNLLTPRGRGDRGTIIWNPELRSELEPGCDGDAERPVTRDPIASLLHELAHAVDDCEGRDPGARELEAVRVENIYRRSAGLCQRSAYGEDRLAPWRTCPSGSCTCPVVFVTPASQDGPPVAASHVLADSPRTGGEIDVDPAPDRHDDSGTTDDVRNYLHLVPRITHSESLQR